MLSGVDCWADIINDGSSFNGGVLGFSDEPDPAPLTLGVFFFKGGSSAALLAAEPPLSRCGLLNSLSPDFFAFLELVSTFACPCVTRDAKDDSIMAATWRYFLVLFISRFGFLCGALGDPNLPAQ